MSADQYRLPSGPATTVHGMIIDHSVLRRFGLTTGIVRSAIQHTHRVLDRIDDPLLESGGYRLATLIELANLSAIIGNLFRRAISDASDGIFMANRPHTYPDLIATDRRGCDIEIKVALETNKPKGHLIKPGPHLTVRYVLASADLGFSRGRDNRGDVPWIWEVRAGVLEHAHFGFSNTPGDSGKTAVINAAGMAAMPPVFIDPEKCPFSPRGQQSRDLARWLHSTGVSEGCLREIL